MQNIAKTISNYIKANYPNIVIYFDLFPKDNIEGVILVHDPSTRVLTEYVDGTKELQLNISFTARYKKASECRNVLENILSLLDGVKLADETDDLKLKINTVANVQFIGTDDKVNSIYTCSIAVFYKTSSF